MLLHHSIQEHSLVATGIPWHNRIVRDWYTGCAQPSQGCETGSTPVFRFSHLCRIPPARFQKYSFNRFPLPLWTFREREVGRN